MDLLLRHLLLAAALFTGLIIGSGCKTSSKPATEIGYVYTVLPGDTVEAIAAAFRDQHVEVTAEQILKANPQVHFLDLDSTDWTAAPGVELFIPISRERLNRKHRET